jgi:1-acyl-sn-glycerol-3-phosphate acyltransferase
MFHLKKKGTRSRKEFLPFKNGAYNLAAELEMPLLPVSIFIPGDIWAKGTKVNIFVYLYVYI